jgi:hypothetical protein
MNFEDLRVPIYVVDIRTVSRNELHAVHRWHEGVLCGRWMNLGAWDTRPTKKLSSKITRHQAKKMCRKCEAAWQDYVREGLVGRTFLCGKKRVQVKKVEGVQLGMDHQSVLYTVEAGGRVDRTGSIWRMDLTRFLKLIRAETSAAWQVGANPRDWVWFFREKPLDRHERCATCGERTHATDLDEKQSCRFCSAFSMFRSGVNAHQESAQGLMDLLWRVVEKSAPDVPPMEALHRIIDRWSGDLSGAATHVHQQVSSATTLLRVAAAAEMQLSLAAQPKTVERLREMGRPAALVVIRQLLREGFVTLDEIDPPPDKNQ